MPEERIGTRVELDITKYLGDLAKLGTAWQKYLDVLDATYPTSEKVNKALTVTTDRIKELRLLTEKLTKEEKKELTVLRGRAAGLKDLVDSYKKLAAAEKAGAAETARATKETEQAVRTTTDAIAAAHIRQQKAAEDAARAQEQAARKAEQAQKRQKRAAKAAARALERYTKSVTMNLKKMFLWVGGAASAYRAYMKLRRAIEEATREVYGHTEEMKALTTAWDDLTHAVVLSLVSYDEALESMDRMAGLLNDIRDGLLGTSAELDGYTAAAQTAAESSGYFSSILQGVLSGFSAFGSIAQQYVGWLTVAAARTGLLSGETARLVLSSYDLAKAQREATNATAMAAAAAEDSSKRQKAAAQAYERYQQRLYRITETRLQGLLRAHKTYYDALADMALEDARRAEDLAIELARRREDWARNAARRRAALLRQYNEQSLQAERNYARNARRLAEDRARRLLEIERRYQDRLLEIERSYSRSMYEAIATRDATAALRAMRQRREDLSDAKRDRDRARKDVESDYTRRLRELRENLEEQRRQARRSYEEALEELNRSLREQEEDLALSLRRREEDAELSRRRQLQDLKMSLAEQMRAVLDQYRRDRRLANIEYRYREDAFARHLARMRAIALAYQAASPTSTGTTPSFGVPPGVIPSFAEGGAMVVTRPTTALFGERGPELIIAQPLPPAPQSFMVSGSVRHEVSTIIQQSMAGFEGRIAGAVHSALAEVIR